jgi:hypothetical protein
MLNVKIYLLWWFLGGPPMFVACQSISVVVIRAVGSGGFFCFSPLIACLFFVAGVLSMLEMQVFSTGCNTQR